MIELPTFRIRASAASEIVAPSKDGGLSAGAKTYCRNWLIEKLYGRTKQFSSKYTDKGNAVESDAIQMAALYYGWGLVDKNEQFYQDADLMGTPDLILPERIVELKNSWDCFTFPIFEPLLPKNDYYWQVQEYMELTGSDKAEVIYCLMDTPEHLIEREALRISRDQGDMELEQELFDQVKDTMTYSHLPIQYRLKRFQVAHDPEAIKLLRSKVEQCRAYINELIAMI